MKRCTFELGVGIGGIEITIDNQKGEECVQACIEKRHTDGKINGVTIPNDSEIGGCWCNSYMKGRNKNNFYKSCFLNKTGKVPLTYFFLNSTSKNDKGESY